MMQRLLRLLVVSMLPAAGMLACMRPQVIATPLGAEQIYPATPDTVIVPLYSTAKPECPYDEIAAITAEWDRSHDVLGALRQKARAVGGQAIVGYMQSERPDGNSVRSGTAIRFRSASCMK
jgi:hypothetical protein